MSQQSGNFKFSLRPFSGVKGECTNNYVRPILREDSDQFVIHIGTKMIVIIF